MADLIVLVPSRGRPESVTPLAEAFNATCTADTALSFIVDDDDPALPDYRRNIETVQAAGGIVGYGTGASKNMVQALNGGARLLVTAPKPPYAVGFIGDDHCPRTKGWDGRYLEALRELGTGIVYGDDLYQGERLPTQCAMTADIIQALGYMSPPSLVHMYVDDAWLHLGRAAGCIRYLPDVVVEHVHPIAGKGEWDDGYRRVNDPAVYGRDRAAFARWQATELPEAVRKIRALRGEP
jgi:hypothetical protein